MIFFTCSDDTFVIYMGADKHENEHLIKWGWPEDIWFHVDSLSSAHVYLRCPEKLAVEDIPDAIIEECCQLVKHNSIKGSKLSECVISYTPWENLHKRGDMDVGTIGFHNNDAVRKRRIAKDKAIIKKIEKTRTENVDYDYQKAREKRDRKIQRAEKKAKEKKKKAAKAAKKSKHYEDLGDHFAEENMTSNKDINMIAQEYEDSFM